VTSFVLVHSPSVGPLTWRPVADRLRELGHDVVVPDLRRISAGGPPYWPRVVAAVTAALADLPAGPTGPATLAVHSNAGLFVPALVEAVAAGALERVVFVDAGLPAPGGTPVAPPEFLEFLRGLADEDGVLPRWTDWWPPEAVAELLPEPAIRAGVIADQPRLPLDYYEQALPDSGAWRALPGAYLLFSPAYDEEATRARTWGWPVQLLPGEHLHQLVDPGAVAAALLTLTG
jgi:hypothetical protein